MESELLQVAGAENREALSRASHEAAKRAAAKALIAAGERAAPDAIAIAKDARGKPHAALQKNKVPIMISIAHAYPYALGVATLMPDVLLGADIEPVRDSILRTKDDFLTEEEHAWITKHASNEHVHLITRAWVFKEAVLKALGTGLRLHPGRVDVRDALKAPDQINFAAINLCGRTIEAHIRPIAAPEGFVAAAVIIPSNSAILEAPTP